MTRAKKLTIGLLSSVVFACALFCTANFAFADENPLQKIQDTLNSLYAGNDVVYQDVYGVIADEYATAATTVSFDSNEDTAIDIIKSDGSVKFRTSTAMTKIDTDPVWQDYVCGYKTYEGDFVAYPYDEVGKALEERGCQQVVKKDNLDKFGLVDCEGNFVVPINYATVYINDYFNYGLTGDNTTQTFDLYSKTTFNKIKTITWTGSYGAYFSFHNNGYFTVGNGSEKEFYSIENDVVTEKTDIKSIDSCEEGCVYVTTDNKVYYENAQKQETLIYASDDTISSAYCNGNVVTVSETTESQDATTTKYFTLHGVELTSSVPQGYSSSRYFNGYNVFGKYNLYTSEAESVFIPDDGQNPISFSSYPLYQIDDKVIMVSIADNKINITAKNSELEDIKTLATYDKQQSDSLYFFSKKTNCFEGFYISHYWSGGSEGATFDKDLNKIEGDVPDYQLLTGKKIFRDYDYTRTPTTKFLDEDGNEVVINGYKLAIYCDSEYASGVLQHNGEDIWWAIDSNNKYGCIDSYGNVVVPFEYDKQLELSTNTSDMFMGFKDNKWGFYRYHEGPSPKPAPIVESTTETTVKLSWAAVADAEKYAVATKNADGSFKTYTLNLQDTTYTITGLKQNTTYKCLVQAYVNGQWSAYTEDDLVLATTQAHVEPGAPAVTATPNGDGKVSLEWDAIENADKYAAYEVIDGTFKPINENLQVCTVDATDLANYYEHTFLVQAHVGDSWSKYTKENYVSATPEGPIKPTLETPEVTGTDIKLKWNKVSGATKYAVATKVGSSKYTTYTLDCTDTTYTINGLEEGVKYDCLVQAYINGKWSEFEDSDLKQATTRGNRPVVDAQPTGNGKVTLTWDEIDGADKYAAYEVINGIFKPINENLQVCTVDATDLANYYEHAFLVQAHVGGSWSKYSERNYAYATPTGTVKPTLNNPEVTGTSIKLTWDKVPGANRYAVATRTETSGYVTHSYSVTDTEFTISGLEDSTKYYCLVQANINGKWSDFSRDDEKYATTKGTRPVVSADATGDGKVTLSWAAIENADKYVAYEIVNGSFNQIGDFMPSGTTTKEVTNLANGYEHTFLVQAQVNGVWSKYSKDNYVTATPTGRVKPTLQTPVVSGTDVSLTWDAVPGATRYAVASKYEVGDNYTTYTYDITSTECTIQNLQQGIKYYFLVQAEVNGNWSSFTSDDLKQAVVEGGESPIVDASPTASGQVTLTWNSIPNASYYLAYEYKNGKYNLLKSLPQGTTSLVVDDLANEKQHVFLVQAFVNQHYSAFSQANLACATPTGPVKPTFRVEGTSADSVTVSWDPVPGATDYAAAVREPSGKYISLFLDKNARSATIGALDAGTDYYALVQCKIDGVWSAFTDADHIKATTVVGAPSAKAVVKDKVMTFYYDGISHKASDTTVYWVPSNPQSYTEIPWITGTGQEHSLTVDVTNVVIDSSYSQFKPTSLNYMFAYMNQAVAAPEGCEYINTSEVTSMIETFGCYGAKGYCASNPSASIKQPNGTGVTGAPNVANWDTSKVTSMKGLFECYGATSSQLDAVPDVSNWNTSKVTDFSSMFWCYGGDVRDTIGSTVLSKVPNVTNWNTSSAQLLDFMFFSYGANSTVLNTAPNVASWNVAKVTSMYCSFESYGCGSKVLDCVPNVTNWNTSACQTFLSMFSGYGSSSTALSSMPDVSKWNTSSATKSYGTGLGGLAQMFSGYGKSTTKDLTIDLRSFTVNTDFSNMFNNCAGLKTIYCNSNWSSYSSYSVFTGCTKLVGGAGTTYSSDKVSGVYARVDGGTSNPGYFTSKA